MAKQLAASDPDNADWQFELGQSHFWVGFLRWQERDLEAALGQFEAYAQISESLVERDPSNSTWQLELAYSHSNVGQVYQERGDLDIAGQELGLSAAIFEGLIAEGDEGHTLSVELAHVYNKLAKVLEAQGRLKDALARYQSSLAAMRRASDADPEDVRRLRFLGLAHTHIGEVHRLLGKDRSALASFGTALEIAGNVAARDQDNLIWRAELALSSNRLSRACFVANELACARSSLEEAEQLAGTLLDLQPQHTTARLSLALAQWTRALLAEAVGNTHGAAAQAESAKVGLAELESETSRVLYRRLLAEAGAFLADVQEDLGNAAGARATRESAEDVARALLAENRSPQHLAIHVRLLLGLGSRTEAEPLIAELATDGYRETAYRRILAEYGLANR